MKTQPDVNRDFNLAEACQSVFSPTRLPEQPKITLDMFKGQEIPFNLHGPIREMVKQLEAKDWAQDQLVEIYGNALAKITAQRDELLAAAKEARMALTLDYHGTTRPKKALCDLSSAASQAHNKIVLAIAKCEAQP